MQYLLTGPSVATLYYTTPVCRGVGYAFTSVARGCTGHYCSFAQRLGYLALQTIVKTRIVASVVRVGLYGVEFIISPRISSADVDNGQLAL